VERRREVLPLVKHVWADTLSLRLARDIWIHMLPNIFKSKLIQYYKGGKEEGDFVLVTP
jgi:hypothetical protein